MRGSDEKLRVKDSHILTSICKGPCRMNVENKLPSAAVCVYLCVEHIMPK